ncbi:hypothetical protein [uncultured Sulfitobacter sp.]|uniref:hypothetical protein n=1 Tax=uncultured Sulfitobacter sp. TaxID=191468 RepID=UPI0026383ACF|nr:hypothetical protein [uncultured Sulfitobacter sp.]
MSDQEFPDDPNAEYELYNNLILPSQNKALDGKYVQDLLNGTVKFEGQTVVIEDTNLDAAIDLKDLPNPNESAIN